MLVEQRQIRFSPEGLVFAIASSPAAAAALGLPPLRPRAVRLLADTSKVEVLLQGGAGSRSVAIELLPLAALLLSFCFRANIPLPRRARKAARIEGDSVVLEFTLDVVPDPAKLRPEGVMPVSSSAKPLDWGAGATRV